MIEELEIRLEAIAGGEVFDEDDPKKKKENPSLDHKIKTINRDKSKSPGRAVVSQQVVTTRTRTKSLGRAGPPSGGDRGRSPARPSASGPPNERKAPSKSPARPSVSN